MKTTLALCLLTATGLSAQASTTRTVGNRTLGALSKLAADTFPGSTAGATCESRLSDHSGSEEYVRIDARFRLIPSSFQHEQRVRLYIGGTLLYYRNQASTRLIREDADESIASFKTQTRFVEVDLANTTGTEAGSGGAIGGNPYLAIYTTIGARGQLTAASARTGNLVGADADLRTWAWSSGASVGIGVPSGGLSASQVNSTMNVKDRLWLSMQATPQSAGGTLYAMANDNSVYQHFSATGVFYPINCLTPVFGGWISIPYPAYFDESRGLVNDVKLFPSRTLAVD
ncbi:MAG: hypothetical protein R3F56_21640 [Planctomycetota bacterium]